MASPASSHPTVKTAMLGAAATIRRLSVPRIEPVVITVRGPRWSMMRPTRIPTAAETSSAAEKAAVVVSVDHPVSAVICGFKTGKA